MAPFVLPLTLEWRLTDACNLRCRYCLGNKPAYRPYDCGPMLQRIVELAPRYIWLGGGEPTLVEGLPAVAAALKERLDPHIGMNTNLTRPQAVREMLPYIDDLIISLDTLDEAVSREHRGVEPRALLESIREMDAAARGNGYPVVFTVNSVACRHSLGGRGIEELNDALAEINPRITHQLSVVLPAGEPESIVNDAPSAALFFALARKLREKGRMVTVNFPAPPPAEAGTPAKPAGPFRCFRRYFRVGAVEDRGFFSLCPPADPADPVCDEPCNCVGFLDNVLHAAPGQEVDERLLRGRLSAEQEARLRDFVKTYIDPRLPDTAFARLVRKARA